MLKYSLLVSVVMGVVKADDSDNSICWTTEVKNINPIPAGREIPATLYVCRKLINGDSVPGKLFTWPDNKSVTCNLAYKGEHRWENPPYQMLIESPGTTSWIPYDGFVTINNVLGGQLNNALIYVCRGLVGDSLLPGYLVQEDKTCYVEIGGNAQQLKEDFEVLIRNKYGEIMNTKLCT